MHTTNNLSPIKYTMRSTAKKTSTHRRVQQNNDDQNLEKLAKMANLLDSRYRIPGTNRHIGLDGLIGLIPGVGDITTTAFSLYIVVQAAQYGIPKTRILHMLWNVGIDTVIGSIPLVGDLFDIGWKANIKNIDILRSALNHKRA